MHAVAELLVAEERGYLDGLQEKDEARGGTDPGEYVAVNMSLCMAAG